MKKNIDKKLKNKKSFFLVFALLISSSNAYAYLDPGTGGLIIQAVIAIFIGVGIFFSNIKLKFSIFFKSMMQQLKGRKSQESKSKEENSKN